MNAAELREALEALDQLLGAFAEWVSDEQNDEARDWALVKLAPFASRAETIRDAARTIALPILEAGLSAEKIREAAGFASVIDSEQDMLRTAALFLADLLAAISTPTPGETQ